MASNHSWKWLPSRPSLHSAPASSPNSRPCLPQVEQLDDRLLLSATPDIIIKEGGGATAVLIGLLKGNVGIVSDELAALNIAADLSGQKFSADYIKFTDAFNKLDDLLYNLGDVLIKEAARVDIGDIHITKPTDKASTNIAEELVKIEMLANTIGGAGAEDVLLPAVNKLAGDTMALVNELIKLAPQPDTITQKQAVNFLRISDEFLKIDQDIITIGSDTAIGKDVPQGKMQYLQVELKQVLISSVKLNDPDLQKAVLGIEADTLALLQGNDGGGGGIV